MGESRKREARLRRLPGVSLSKRPGGPGVVESGLDCRPPKLTPRPGVSRGGGGPCVALPPTPVWGGGERPETGRREGIWRRSSAKPPTPIPTPGLRLGKAQADAQRFPQGVVLRKIKWNWIFRRELFSNSSWYRKETYLKKRELGDSIPAKPTPLAIWCWSRSWRDL